MELESEQEEDRESGEEKELSEKKEDEYRDSE